MALWQAQARPIVYIDESGFAHDMPRTHGYSDKGQPCYGKKDWGAKGRSNVIGALMGKTLLSACLVECTVDSDVFHAWVTKQLLAVVPYNAVIVMDNATFHKRQDTQQAIRKAGLTLEFLPPYSPELNPIEKLWAKAKAIIRNVHCSIEQLFAFYMFNYN